MQYEMMRMVIGFTQPSTLRGLFYPEVPKSSLLSILLKMTVNERNESEAHFNRFFIRKWYYERMKNKRKQIECIILRARECEGKESTSARWRSIEPQTFFELSRVASRSGARSHYHIAKVGNVLDINWRSLWERVRRRISRVIARVKIASRFALVITATTVRVFAFPLSGTETYGGRMIRSMYKFRTLDKESCVKSPSIEYWFVFLRRVFIGRKYR